MKYAVTDHWFVFPCSQWRIVANPAPTNATSNSTGPGAVSSGEAEKLEKGDIPCT